MAKGKGLALVAVVGIAALAASGAAGASPGPRPLPPPPTPKPDENEGVVPEAIRRRVALALATLDPTKMRAEASRLRAEGWLAQALSLEDAASDIEARDNKPPTPAPPKPPAPQPAAPRDLVRGMKGEDVRSWQKQLIKDGFVNISADADFGELTYAATKEWQWERQLTDDGIVGAKSREAIGTPAKRKRGAPAPAPAPKPPAAPAAPKPPAASTPPVAPKPPSTPNPAAAPTVPVLLVNVTLREQKAPQPVDERVKLWQDKLKALGFRPAVKSDGMFGPNTTAQTKALQSARGLDPTGIADPVTIATAYGAAKPKAAPAPAAPKPPATAPASPAVPPLLVNLSTWRSNMKKGNKGDDVREWQAVLARYGYAITPDGDFGDLTVAATKQWQTDHARFNDAQRAPLTPDGEVGKNTRDRIAELERGKSIVAGDLDQLPADVRAKMLPMLAASTPQILGIELERHLRVTPPGLEDRELVQQFQRAHGLNDTGVYGPATAEALIPLGIVPPEPREWPTKKLFRAKTRYRVALREAARRDPLNADEWLRAAGRV